MTSTINWNFFLQLLSKTLSKQC